MNNHHHPDLIWLIDYANDALGAGFRTVVAGHLRGCAACRTQLAAAVAIGTQLVATAPVQPAPMTAAQARATAPRRALTAPGLAPTAAAVSLHAFVADVLGFAWPDLDWRRGTPGLHIARLRNHAEEHIWLLRAGPGVAMPVHTHEGAELTLILDGAYAGAGYIYRAGDVDDNDETMTHQPIVTADASCTSLLVFSGRLRYTGLIMGVGQKLLGY